MNNENGKWLKFDTNIWISHFYSLNLNYFECSLTFIISTFNSVRKKNPNLAELRCIPLCLMRNIQAICIQRYTLIITERKRKKWKTINCLIRFWNDDGEQNSQEGELFKLQHNLQTQSSKEHWRDFGCLIHYLHFIEFDSITVCTVYCVNCIRCFNCAFHISFTVKWKTPFIFSVHCCHCWHWINISIFDQSPIK